MIRAYESVLFPWNRVHATQWTQFNLSDIEALVQQSGLSLPVDVRPGDRPVQVQVGKVLVRPNQVLVLYPADGQRPPRFAALHPAVFGSIYRPLPEPITGRFSSGGSNMQPETPKVAGAAVAGAGVFTPHPAQTRLFERECRPGPYSFMSLRQEAERLRRERDQLSEAVRVETDTNTKLQRENERLRRARHDGLRDATNLRSELAAAKLEITTLRNKVGTESDLLVRAERDQLSEALTDERTANETLRTQLTLTQTQLEDQKRIAEHRVRERDLYAHDLHNLRQENKALTDELTRIRSTSHVREVLDLRARVQSLAHQLSVMTERLSETSQKLKTEQTNRQAEKTILEALHKDYDKLRAANWELENKIRSVRTQFLATKQKIEEALR